ncbi:flagellar basal body-associated protein FliL [Solidesulfovibrio carbinoliphilus subsp. oakridgensis]|uniref:Flagellar protein FliL n=1 Tax=Solidesulfovibrio carbinoliphilus subsp. oakridgensis TaxID=694327 RepID=G7QCU4_9BACT|nr:flagellar basal body-associated FliL family protein [Solidesulfovibrio carbinoliphilus]EHJ46250.1 flagellar basal body-associated protein FliL [Solidesulfovibrio carbinoliphilus subsp. oakridgensis]
MRHAPWPWPWLLAALLVCLLWPRGGNAQSDAVVRGGIAVYPGLDVNIADGGRLARLHIAFEAQCVDAPSAQMAAAPQTREAILLFLRDKTVAELATVPGKRKLKQDLLAVMNKAVGGPRVVRLYFLQLVVL